LIASLLRGVRQQAEAIPFRERANLRVAIASAACGGRAMTSDTP
jgi:hypothetical protein